MMANRCQICNEPIDAGTLCPHCAEVAGPDWADAVIDRLNRLKALYAAELDADIAAQVSASDITSLQRALVGQASWSASIRALDTAIGMVRDAAIAERRKRLISIAGGAE